MFKLATTFPITFNGKTLQGISGEGVENTKLVIIGMCPGGEEEVEKRPFVGPSGQLLNDLMSHVNIDRKSIWLTNIVNFRTQDNGRDIPPTPEEVEVCSEYLDKELDRIKPKIIGVLGNDAVRRILGKVGGITRIRGVPVWSDRYNAFVVPTYHPSYILRCADRPKLREDMLADLKLMNQLASGKEEESFPTKVYYYKTVTEVSKLVDHMVKQNVVAFDIETDGEETNVAKIKCIGFSWKEKEGHVITDPENEDIKELLRTFFTSKVKTVAQNGNFDMKVLEANGIKVHNFKFDTMLAHHLLDENTKHGLKQMSWTYTDMGGYESGLSVAKGQMVNEFRAQLKGLRDTVGKLKIAARKSKTIPDVGKLVDSINEILDKVNRAEADRSKRLFSLEEFPKEIMWKYCGADCDCTFRLYKVFSKNLVKEGLASIFSRISMPFSKIIKEMEVNGIKIDLKRLSEMKEKQMAILTDIEFRLREFPAITKAEKRINKDSKNPQPINFGSSAQLQVLFFDVLKLPANKQTKTGYSTDVEVLESLSNLHEIPNLIVQHRKVSKLISTYLEGIEKRLDKDGRLHTSFLQHGTVTGRLASRNPNMQNIPKDGEIKEIFIAEDGHLLFEADFKQMDFRMWANQSKDGQMYIDLTTGVDIHKVIAAQIYDVREENVTEEQRNAAKTVLYASIYGIAPFN